MARVFLLLFVITFLHAPVRAQDAKRLDDVTIDDIVAGLKKQEAAMQTLQVTLRVRQINNFGAIYGGGNRTRSSFTEQWHINTQCVGWNNATGSTITVDNEGKRREKDFEHHSAFDGELGTSLTTEEGETGVKRNSGTVGKAFMRYALPPCDFTFGHQQSLVSETLKDHDPKIVGKEDWEGHEVLLVETLHNSKDRFLKSQYWIDPNRDFLVVSRRNLSKDKAEDPWFTHFAVDSKKHKKYADSVWLPQLVEKRSYGKPKESREPIVFARMEATCADWKINEPIDKERLRIKFPKGLKVHGADQYDIEFEESKSLGFFAAPIKTPLQRSLLRSRNADVYAVVDATSFADPNTGQINPSDFDMQEFKKQLKDTIGGPNQTLMLNIEFGTLGHEETLQAFVTEPLKSFARSAGFKNIRVSSSVGGRQAEFNRPDDLPETSDETDLGGGDWSIYVIGTPLGRYIAGDAQILITSKKHIPMTTSELLDAAAVEQIKKALEGQDLEGKKLEIKFTLGDKDSKPDDAEDLEVTKQSSDIQLDAVSKLSDMGFGDIVLKVTVSYTTHVSGYKQ